ncbi:MAG: DUF4440 domain-containing protein [Dermatophilaceae bacterium]
MNDSLPPEALEELVAQAEAAADAYVRGDLEQYTELVRHADVFTLLPPNGGPPARHKNRSADLRDSPSSITDGSARLEHVSTHAWGDTLVIAMIERQHGRVEGRPDQRLDLRVTHVYRHVAGNWRLVHRHADPLVEAISLGELLTTMSP